MKKYLLIFCCFLAYYVQASHMLGGEITYEREPTSTRYFFTVSLIYRADNVTISPNDGARIDVSALSIDYGDNNNVILPINGDLQNVGNGLVKGTYKGTHMYSAASGNYVVSVTDNYRAAGIVNIPQSDDKPLFFTTSINLRIVDQGISFLNFPHAVQKDVLYTHEPQILNPDQDSLAFSLVIPLSGAGKTIDDYKYPNDPSLNNGKTDVVFAIDSKTGKITWDKPTAYGYYTIAIQVRKYKSRIHVGTTVRDYTLVVRDGAVGVHDEEHKSAETLLSSNLLQSGNQVSARFSGDLTIRDLKGQVVFQQNNYVQDSPLVLNLHPGMYMCTFQGAGQQRFEKLMVE